MKLLAIGNSFSQDATRYLRAVARAGGEEWEVINLFIGGCPLQTHALNAQEDRSAYEVQLDGRSTGEISSIKKALQRQQWDVVTLQQASTQSHDYAKFQPYLDFMIGYVRQYAPSAKLYLHQTWAYPEGSDLLQAYGHANSMDMFEKVEKAYAQAMSETKMDGFIPTGELVKELTLAGIEHLYRDNLHLSFGIGRYAAARLWYAVLGGKDVSPISISAFDEEVDAAQIALVNETIAHLMR